MSNTLTIRLPEDLAEWQDEAARGSGVSRGLVVRTELERARNAATQPLMSLAGAVKGPPTFPLARASRVGEGHRGHGVFWFHSATRETSITHGQWKSRGLSPSRCSLATQSSLKRVSSGQCRDCAGVCEPRSGDLADHTARLEELAKRYAGRKPDLADLCLIRMSELHPRHQVITTDVADFRLYRRGRWEAIPLICPPSR